MERGKIEMIKNVVEYLEKTAERFPQKTAIIDENGSISFQEMRKKARSLASQIIEDGYFKEPIIVFLPKGKECIVSFLAAGYSGNFYTPISVDMPVERIKKIEKTLKAAVVITSREYYELISGIGIDATYYFYEDIEKYSCNDKVVEETLQKTIDTDLLYVLFTSGSTGDPKGVTICHRSVIDYTEWVGDTFNITEQDSFGNQAPFYFDNSILDIYGMLRNGATLNIIPQELFSYPVLLLKYLNDNKISTIFWVPSALILVANLRALKEVDLKYTKKVLFCGEAMPNKQLNLWRKYNPDSLYANLYGPTEITDVCTYYIVDREFDDVEPLPIGIPCRNTDILVLNDKDELVVGDEIGELCVRGTSLSRGYYNNPMKTNEAFVQNPLNSKYYELIYRTGDLVKYNEFGELIYLSRKDFQIKHKGHRVELGEIETMANSLPYISTSCCLYDEKRSRIVFFYVDNVNEADIVEDLGKLLPDYMIPGHFIKLENMPMNLNGKIDRTKLKKEFIKQ